MGKNLNFHATFNMLPIKIADEVANFLDYEGSDWLPEWMLAKDNGGPGPEPKDRDSEEYYAWSDAAHDFVEKNYPGVDYNLLDERDSSFRRYGSSFTPDCEDISQIEDAVEKGYLKGVSDILKHHGLDCVVKCALIDSDECRMKMYAVTRQGVHIDEASDYDVAKKAEKALEELKKTEKAHAGHPQGEAKP